MSSVFAFQNYGKQQKKRQTDATMVMPPALSILVTLLLLLLLLSAAVLPSLSDATPMVQELALIRRPLEPHTPHISRMTRLPTTDADIKLYGDWLRYGEYYAQITIGSQNFTVQVDTGSSDLAIPMVGCSTCGTPRHAPYDPNKSASSSPILCSSDAINCQCARCTCLANNQCKYTLNYADQSGFTAEVFNDTVTIGPYSVNMAVGAITSERSNSPLSSGFQPATTDGIIGFAYPSASEINANTFFGRIVEQGHANDLFSMCLTKNGGALTLGGIGHHYAGEINYTPIYKSNSFYRVYLHDMMLDGSSIGVPPSEWNGGEGTVVDSGTTDIVMPRSAYLALKSSFLRMCSNTKLKGICSTDSTHTLFDGYCYGMTAAELAMFPAIQIVLGEQEKSRILLTVPPQQYLVSGRCQSSSYVALAIDYIDGIELTLLGDSLMQGYEVVFDRANSRIGFGNVSNCPSYYDEFMDPLGIIVFIITICALCCCCCCPLLCCVCMLSICIFCMSSSSNRKGSNYAEIHSTLGAQQQQRYSQRHQQYSAHYPQQYQQYPAQPHPPHPSQYGSYTHISPSTSMYGQIYPQPAPQAAPYLPSAATYAYPNAPSQYQPQYYPNMTINGPPQHQNLDNNPAWPTTPV